MIGVIISIIITMVGMYLCFKDDSTTYYILGHVLAFIGGAIFAYSLSLFIV